MKYLVVIISILFVHGNAFGDKPDARSAYDRKDYSLAANIWRQEAENGNVEAQYFLGRMYEMGRGVPRDRKISNALFLRAAEQGFAPAQVAIGQDFRTATIGRLSKDEAIRAYQSALNWYLKAARQDYVPAYTALGNIYNGDVHKGGEPDEVFIDAYHNEAIYWYLKAAKRGDCQAQLNLGFIYKFGRGYIVQVSWVKFLKRQPGKSAALFWHTLSFEGQCRGFSSPTAKSAIDDLKPKMKAADISKVMVNVEQWKERYPEKFEDKYFIQ